MDSSNDGGFSFLHSWSDDLDPAARRRARFGGAVIDLDGVYLPDADAPAFTLSIIHSIYRAHIPRKRCWNALLTGSCSA
jgi:hypothetical protein